MNDPSVAVSPADTVLRSGDRGRAENLVQETITRFALWTARWQLASPRRALLFTGFAWLSIAVIALRFTLASVTTDALAVAPFQGLGDTDSTTGVGLGLEDLQFLQVAERRPGTQARVEFQAAGLLAEPRSLLFWREPGS